jgi:hypothetical protein
LDVGPPGAVGFSIGGEDTRMPFVGWIKGNRFVLRRPRPLISPPRVVVLRGTVEATQTGSIIRAGYSYNPAVQVAAVIYLLFFVSVALIVMPIAVRQPEILWVVVVLGLVTLLFFVPFAYQARYDRAALRSALEECRHAAPTAA